MFAYVLQLTESEADVGSNVHSQGKHAMHGVFLMVLQKTLGWPCPSPPELLNYRFPLTGMAIGLAKPSFLEPEYGPQGPFFVYALFSRLRGSRNFLLFVINGACILTGFN